MYLSINPSIKRENSASYLQIGSGRNNITERKPKNKTKECSVKALGYFKWGQTPPPSHFHPRELNTQADVRYDHCEQPWELSGSRMGTNIRMQTKVPVIADSGNYRLINLPLIPSKVLYWIAKQATSEHLKKTTSRNQWDFTRNWLSQSLFPLYVFFLSSFELFLNLI